MDQLAQNRTEMNEKSFRCSTYSKSQRRAIQECSGHYVPTGAVRELILLTLRTICPWAIKNKENFAARVREESELRQKDAVKEARRQMSIMKKRHVLFAYRENRYDKQLEIESHECLCQILLLHSWHFINTLTNLVSG